MKKRLQAALLAAVVLVSALVWAPPAHAVGTVTVSRVCGAVGELVDVTISLTSDDVDSGNFDVRYDSAALELVQTQTTNEFHCLANPYEAGRVRVSFMRMEAITQAQLCTLTFRVTQDTSADGSAVVLERVILYGNDAPVGAEVIHGSVERKTVRLSMKPVDTAMYQAVGAVVELGGTLAPAGGNFSISYDPECFEVKSVLALEAMGGALWQYNVVEPGLVRVSFSSATALKAGPLCSVVFQSVGNAGSGSELIISDARMYGEDQNAVDVSVVNGSLNIVVPSDDDPKLWVVGGAMQENGSARAAVVLQGRGYACGGNFTLTYDPAMTVSVQTSADCQINHDTKTGTIQVSWASATPYSGEAEMLAITFMNAVESTVGIENVTLYYAESEAIPVADVRPGKISAAETVTAVVDETVVETVGDQSSYTVTVDVADMNYFTDKAVESITSVLALYEDGRLVGLSMQAMSAFQSGVSEIELSAQTDKIVDGISVFLLESAEALIPLTRALDAGIETE